MGGVVDLMGSRKGQMLDMAASTEGLNRVTYKIPTRGLLGLRNAILTATKASAQALKPLKPCADMAASTEGLCRVTYKIPTRGLLGLRNAILTATKARAQALKP